jgi:hypothetical protein
MTINTECDAEPLFENWEGAANLFEVLLGLERNA